MIALDTNLLLYAHRSATPEHRRAQIALERAAEDASGWGISVPVLGEFWSIVTSAKASGRASTALEAASFVRALIDEGGMKVWMPTANFATSLLEHATQLLISGVKIFDLQIGLIALLNGAREIWTHDIDFVRVPGIKIYDPL